MAREDKYLVGSMNLAEIRNRNEIRVIKALGEMLKDSPDFCGCQLCVEDAYALAMNQVLPHYVQRTTIVLAPKTVSEESIRESVASALKQVGWNPNHPASTD
ncbi:MAG: late competence development ComFB family protein [bacterium]